MTPPVAELLRRHEDAWVRATRHPFLARVRDGTLPADAFERWLAQDRRFVADLLRFQRRLLEVAPGGAQPVLAAGSDALVEELAWFDRHAAARGLALDVPSLPATAAYDALLRRLETADAAVALTALWAIERAYLDAWEFAAPAAPPYAEFVAHWTTPGFRAYVAELEALADEAGGAGDAFLEVVAAEEAFWQMALE